MFFINVSNGDFQIGRQLSSLNMENLGTKKARRKTELLQPGF